MNGCFCCEHHRTKWCNHRGLLRECWDPRRIKTSDCPGDPAWHGMEHGASILEVDGKTPSWCSKTTNPTPGEG